MVHVSGTPAPTCSNEHAQIIFPFPSFYRPPDCLTDSLFGRHLTQMINVGLSPWIEKIDENRSVEFEFFLKNWDFLYKILKKLEYIFKIFGQK
jgi:hypothetical protein